MAVASDQNVVSSGAIGVDIQAVTFGGDASCATACTTATNPCTICDRVGSRITSITPLGSGGYTFNGLSKLKYICSGSGRTGASTSVPLTQITNSAGSFVRARTGDNVAGVDAYQVNAICIGIP